MATGSRIPQNLDSLNLSHVGDPSLVNFVFLLSERQTHLSLSVVQEHAGDDHEIPEAKQIFLCNQLVMFVFKETL